MPGIAASAAPPRSSSSTYSSSRSKHSSQKSSGSEGPSTRSISLPLPCVCPSIAALLGRHRESPGRQGGTQLAPRVVESLVERASVCCQALREHVDRDAVDGQRDQHLALV